MRKCETCIFDINNGKQLHFKKNEHIFFEGDEVSTIYSIKEGIIKLEKLHENGDVRIIDVVTTGDYLALLQILKGGNEYAVTATAITDVIVTPISKEEATVSYNDNLHFKETCLTCAANRLGVFQGHTFNSSNTDLELRIINILKHLSTKFGYYKNGVMVVELPFNKTELANMVGLRRETLSRKLSSMQNDGLIEINKNIFKIY